MKVDLSNTGCRCRCVSSISILGFKERITTSQWELIRIRIRESGFRFEETTMWRLERWPTPPAWPIRTNSGTRGTREKVCSSYWYDLFVSKVVLRKSIFSYHLCVVTTQSLCERRGWLTAQNDLCDVISLNMCCCLRDLAPCWQRNWWQLLMTLDTISRQWYAMTSGVTSLFTQPLSEYMEWVFTRS